jgi:hypothetical protein
MDVHTLVNVVIILIVIGLGLWVINAFVPMAGGIKAILNAVVVIAVLIWLLETFGLWSPGGRGKLFGSSFRDRPSAVTTLRY